MDPPQHDPAHDKKLTEKFIPWQAPPFNIFHPPNVGF